MKYKCFIDSNAVQTHNVIIQFFPDFGIDIIELRLPFKIPIKDWNKTLQRPENRYKKKHRCLIDLINELRIAFKQLYGNSSPQKLRKILLNPSC